MKTILIQNESFHSLWERLGENEKNVSAALGFGWDVFIAWNPVGRFQSNGEDILGFKSFVENERELGRRLFGFLSYDLGYSLLNIPKTAKDDLTVPRIFFLSYDSYAKHTPEGLLLFASNEERLLEYTKEVEEILKRPRREIQSQTKREGFVSEMTKGDYALKFEKARQHIVEGDIYQINLTRRFVGTTKKHSRELFLDIAEANKADYMGYIEGDGFDVLSASPERFVKISEKGVIDTYPIKGTRPRKKDKVEDEKQMQELLHSEKEKAELSMITDLLRNDIGKVSKANSVRVLNERKITPHTSVWHTSSHVQGILRREVSSIDALLSMFPGGSITGCPKKRAMEIIDSLEPATRGVYTGSLGVIDPDGSMDFNIAIRTIVKKGEAAYLQVGGGIVYDSEEESEFREADDKAKSFLDIL